MPDNEQRQVHVDDACFRLAFEACPSPMMLVDSSGEIVAVNKNWESAANCRADSLIGSSFTGFFRCCKCDKDALVLLDGWQGDVDWCSAPLCPQRFFVTVHELSLSKLFLLVLYPQSNDSGASDYSAAFQRRKLESLGVLASSMAHDLNNILTGVLGHVSYLRLAGSTEIAQSESVVAIEHGARRASALSQQILDFARREQVELGTVNLSLVVAAGINLLRVSLPENIELRFRGTAADIFVCGQESQLSQLFMNLTVNAKEALSAGGTIEVSLDVVTLKTAMRTDDLELAPGDYARLSVADNGSGIPADLRARIFEPFFTTKSKRGTGLGLATVYSIVRAHRGLISLLSTEDIGTRFDVYLPLSGAEPTAVEESSRVELPGGAEHILVVDDEEAVRTVIQRSLEHLGYTVVVASGGAEALAVFSEAPQRFSLVIMDMIMPHMSGDQLFYKLREIHAAVRVLVASGYSSDNRTKAILSDGALGFIQKPFAVDELAHEVRRCLDQHH